MGFHKILVAIDDSDLCKSVFAQALELALANKAVLLLFHCVPVEAIAEPIIPSPDITGFNTQMLSSDYEVQKILGERQREETKTLLQSYYQTATSQGVPTEIDSNVGEAGQSLCDVAQRWGADLIVVGRRGRKGLTEALLGSVSNYVLHHAPCSTLVIQHVETN